MPYLLLLNRQSAICLHHHLVLGGSNMHVSKARTSIHWHICFIMTQFISENNLYQDNAMINFGTRPPPPPPPLAPQKFLIKCLMTYIDYLSKLKCLSLTPSIYIYIYIYEFFPRRKKRKTFKELKKNFTRSSSFFFFFLKMIRLQIYYTNSIKVYSKFIFFIFYFFFIFLIIKNLIIHESS